MLLFLAFPPVSAGWLAFPGTIPLFWSLGRLSGPGERGFRGGFLAGWAAGVVFYLLLLHWILYLPNEEITVPGLMFPALLFLAAYMAVYFGLACGLAVLAEAKAAVPLWAGLPVFWTLCDYLRSVGTLSFPWGSLGYALAPYPAALQMCAWTGFWGLTLWCVLTGALLWGGLRARLEGTGGGRFLAAGLGVAILPAVFGAAVLRGAPTPAAESASGMKTALLQANTSREIKWKRGYEGVVIDDLLARTEKAASFDPDLIVWPETAAPVMILWNADLSARVSARIRAIHRWVLVGTLDAATLPRGGAEEYNAAILYNPDGVPVQRYYKTHLLPFSEAMPFQEEIPWINALNFGQSNFSSGREPNLFRIPAGSFAVLICFESIFPSQARKAVAGGAGTLINITNDFWFGRSAGPVQHAEMAILRAVENRTPLARCANSGISFFVDPYGRVSGRTGLFVEARPVSRMAPGTGGSFYTRHGEWLMAALALLGLLALVQTARSVVRHGAGTGAPPVTNREVSHD